MHFCPKTCTISILYLTFVNKVFICQRSTENGLSVVDTYMTFLPPPGGGGGRELAIWGMFFSHFGHRVSILIILISNRVQFLHFSLEFSFFRSYGTFLSL